MSGTPSSKHKYSSDHASLHLNSEGLRISKSSPVISGSDVSHCEFASATRLLGHAFADDRIASRKGGPRIEIEKEKKWNVPVVHAYGHSGAGYQASWGTAERVLELVQKALSPSAKL